MTALAAAAYNEARLAKIAAGNAGGGSSSSLGAWAVPILISKTITFPVAGTVQIAAIGAPGSGGVGAFATGSNSSPIGVKTLEVSANDSISFEIGAGGGRKTGTGAGNNGNNTVVKKNGTVIMTAQPGEAGQSASTVGATPLPAIATVIGADRVIPGLQAQPAVSGTYQRTGGAAVNVFSTGLGRGSEIGMGLVGGSVGVITYGNTITAPIPLRSAELGVSFLGAAVENYAGVGATIGSDSDVVTAGIFAGGAGSNGYGGRGGIGAGGGAGNAGYSSGMGGDGYAYAIFVPKA